MIFAKLVAALLLLFTSVTQVSAFWRMECRGILGYGRVDPLMSPGNVSNHVHTLFGAQNINFESTYASIMDANCTSCIVTQDRSNYWSPALYFMSEDGNTFTRVPNVGGMLAYYLLYGDNVTAFPAGFRMISGDMNLRNFSYPVPDPPKSLWSGNATTQAALAQKALGFNCLNYAKPAEPSLYRHTMPNKAFIDENCADGLRLEVMFPSCWNGKDIDSPDHKSHMAFPDLVMTGNCPPGFETRLISLFYETIWDTTRFQNDTGSFVLAQGDPTGCGYHGDFMMGWDPDFLQSAVNTCTNASGEVEDCPLFSLQSLNDAQSCALDLPAVITHENTTGPREGLPGDITIQYGPEPANEDTKSSSTSESADAVIVSTVTSPLPPPSSSLAAVELLYTSTFTASDGQVVHMVLFEEDILVTVTRTSFVAAASASVPATGLGKRHDHRRAHTGAHHRHH